MSEAAPQAEAPMRIVEAGEVPSQITEMDRLKLSLAKEKQARLQAEAVNLQMAQRALQAQHEALEKENASLFDGLKEKYNLAPSDQILESGRIVRHAPNAGKNQEQPA